MAKFKKKKEKKSEDQMREMLFAEIETTLGMILSLYAFGMSPETFRNLYNILKSYPDTSKWRQQPEMLAEMLQIEEGGCLGKIAEKYPEMFEKLSRTLIEGKLEQMFDINASFDPMQPSFEDYETEEDEAHFDGGMNDMLYKMYVPSEMKDCDYKTLHLKIKLKHISKPPVWREVEVPAWYNFSDLHDVIQVIFGWSDYHLWAFQEKIYRSPYSIRYSTPEDYNYEDTLSPEDIVISTFLKEKGDKIEYVYDFGDDWIHSISVVKVIDKESDYAVLIKAKGDMMVEDIGGPETYEMLRQVYEDRAMMKPSEIRAALEIFGLDKRYLVNIFKDKQLNIDKINDELSAMV